LQGKAHDNRLHPNIWNTLQQNLCISGKVFVNTLYPCICDNWKHDDPSNGHQDYILKCKFIEEEIYMQQPQGFIQEGSKHLMCNSQILVWPKIIFKNVEPKVWCNFEKHWICNKWCEF
jgi:hypothetical protein